MMISMYRVSSRDVYANLALEHWIWKNMDFNRRKIILFWRNSPTVVIGRHQNPWLECKVNTPGVQLARRQSGGGTVYHDAENLNITVFTNQQGYCRRNNLGLTCQALKDKWGLDLSVNKKDDIILNGHWKVSGSSSRLTRDKAYHHYTLLIHTNLEALSSALMSDMADRITSTSATASIKSPVRNLSSVCTEITCEEACEAVAYYFNNKTLGKVETISPQDEDQFPGILQLTEEQKDYEWLFGKTPPFVVRHSFIVVQDQVSITVKSYIEVQKGMIKEAAFTTDSSVIPLYMLASLQHTVKGTRLWPSELSYTLARFIHDHNNNLSQTLCEAWFTSLFYK
ncbi:lipoyl amidotransferase LIPT1, mitochondrial-like [Dysidea avara]|uniref:lipoyl amidotransferase LIPT1, mitochondrial-like n=1 Tax=Dysidea avara TaxID=196820 RepID=UPI00331C36F3